ncbi:MAG: hypothetical protein GY913_33515 [Proteobacteria bacterium]|nr:hypothetical protein [Pseudomonadota bacterium]
MLFLLACQPELPEIPEGLAPLADNTAPLPDSEGIHVVSGEDGDVDWAHAQGLIDADVATVWAALQEHEVVVDRAVVSEWSVVEDTDADYDVSFQVHNTVNDILTVEYTREWRQSVVHETEEGAELVGIRFEKIDGTDVIDVMVGSVILSATEDGQTRLDMVEQLVALQRGPEPLVAYLEDLFEDAQAHSHGEPLPERAPED